ncbi:hypothetical protein KG086_08080 [Lacticaseibacillus chiayiensis]|uniref:hypothetical protein n=1 Tax=Lacticaseibacillus chiayiensis TaxID=2100821 RepID=UPI001BCCD37F|nr:hypothetical protein [Lacticaseibacillus chiayiensis]QVI33781.1 hypothetical protein KG086_08080 [Lacticaseibacillus chiayiensis]
MFNDIGFIGALTGSISTYLADDNNNVSTQIDDLMKVIIKKAARLRWHQARGVCTAKAPYFGKRYPT